MKIISIATLLLLITCLRISAQNPSAKSEAAKLADLQKLEQQLKELDKQFGSIDVDASGDEEKSTKFDVVVQKTAISAPPTLGGKSKIVTTKKNFEIDLTNIEVPDEYINQKIASAFLSDSQNGTCPGVKLMQVGATQDYDVVEDYTYDDGPFKITAWKGFRFDRASIPRIFWVIIDKDSLSNVAPLFHDLLYRHGGKLPPERVVPFRTFTRDQTDDLFRTLMTKCGVNPIRRELAYQAVRKFAVGSWPSQ